MRVTRKLIEAMEQTFQADKAKNLQAKYHLQLNGIGGGTWEIAIANGQCRITPGAPPSSDVYITMNTSAYAKLATGELDMVSAYNQKQVQVITGKQDLALKLTELFTPWASFADGDSTSTAPSPTQPTTPQPIPQPSPQPAPQPAPSPTQPPTPTGPDSLIPSSKNIRQLIKAMEKAFQANKAGSLKARYHFQLAGLGGGDWEIAIANGQCQITPGAPPQSDVYVTMTTTTYIKLATGQLSMMTAYNQRQIQVVTGNQQLALKLADLFSPWASLAGPEIPAGGPSPRPSPTLPGGPVAKPDLIPPQVTLEDIIRSIPRGFQVKKFGKLQATIQFQLEDAGAWRVGIANGKAQVAQGPGLAHLVVGMSKGDFIQLAQGRLNPIQGYQQGRVQLAGHLGLAAHLTNIFAPWAGTIPAKTAPSPPVSTKPAAPQPTKPAVQPTQPVPQPKPAPVPAQPTSPAPQPAAKPQPSNLSLSAKTIRQLIQAMEKAFQPGKAGGLTAKYHFQLTGLGGGTWEIAIANNQCKITPGAPPKSDVYIAMSTATYIKLATGELNIVGAYQQKQVQVITGNQQLALKLAELFPPWASLIDEGSTSTTPAPQPTPTPSPTPAPTPSPAPAPQPAPSVPKSPDSLVARHVKAMPNGYKPGQVGEHTWTLYEFHLSGDGGGIWSVVVTNQKATVSEGRIDDSPTVEVYMSGEDYIKLAQGTLNVKEAFQYQRLKVAGELELALNLVKLFNPWAGTIDSPPPLAPPPQPKAPPAQVQTSVGMLYPQLLNGGFDEYQPHIRDGKTSYWKEPRFPEQYGKYWNLQIINEVDGQVRLTDSGVFGKFTQKYFSGGGHDYKMQGRHSQVVTGRYGFDVVLYQTVAAQPGKEYTFSGNIVSFYKGTSGERADGKIFKTLGIDPTGGQNYNSPNVRWGDRDGKDNEWRKPSLRVKAEKDAITIFIRLENVERDVGQTELNIIHLDDFRLE